MKYLKLKRTIIFVVMICVSIFIGAITSSNRLISTWSYDDLDGNGIITQDELDAFAQKYGFSSNAEMVAAFKDPEVIKQTIEKYDGGIEGDYGSSNSPSNSSSNKEHVHSYTATVTKDATCTEAGEMTYTCSCGDSYTEVIAMKSHNYESTVTKEPTCTETGTETKVCADCGDTIESVIPALGHKAGDWVTEKEATCSEEGRNVRYCTVCGEPVETMMVDKLPHTEGEWEVSQNATLTKPGLKVMMCTECGEILQQEEIPANTTVLYILIGAGAIILIGIIVGVIVYKRRH